MKRMLSGLLAFGLLTTHLSSNAAEVIVDFEDNAIANGTFTFQPFVSSSGCNFDISSVGLGGGLDNGFDGSINGTTHIWGGDVTMSCGTTFDLLSFDLGEDFQETPIRVFIDLFYADGTELLNLVGNPLDGIFGFENRFFFDSSLPTSLTAVRFYAEPDFYIALDNVRISVPEPSTLALFGLGLLGLGFARRKA